MKPKDKDLKEWLYLEALNHPTTNYIIPPEPQWDTCPRCERI